MKPEEKRQKPPKKVMRTILDVLEFMEEQSINRMEANQKELSTILHLKDSIAANQNTHEVSG